MPTRRILVADDEEMQRELIAEYFERRGFDAVAVASGMALRGALDLYDDIVAIVTDNNMGDGPTGLEVLEEIRNDSRYAHIKRVLLSGVQGITEEELRRRVINAGAIFLTKPASLRQILGALELG